MRKLEWACHKLFECSCCQTCTSDCWEIESGNLFSYNCFWEILSKTLLIPDARAILCLYHWTCGDNSSRLYCNWELYWIIATWSTICDGWALGNWHYSWWVWNSFFGWSNSWRSGLFSRNNSSYLRFYGRFLYLFICFFNFLLIFFSDILLFIFIIFRFLMTSPYMVLSSRFTIIIWWCRRTEGESCEIYETESCEENTKIGHRKNIRYRSSVYEGKKILQASSPKFYREITGVSRWKKTYTKNKSIHFQEIFVQILEYLTEFENENSL